MFEENEAENKFDIKEMLEPVIKGVKKHILPIVLLLVIILALFVYLSLPKPASLTVRVVEKDSGTPLKFMSVDILSASGDTIASDSTDESGTVIFDSLPSGQDLSISIESDGKHSTTSQPITLESGSSDSAKIEVPLKLGASFSSSTIAGEIGAGCIGTFPVSVENHNKNKAVQIALIPASSKDAVFFPNASYSLNIPPKGKKSLNISVSALAVGSKSKSGGKISPKLRMKFTSKTLTFNLDIVEAPKIDVSPSRTTCKINTQCKEWIVLKNRGKSVIKHVELKKLGETELANAISIKDFQPNNIPPGSQRVFELIIPPLSAHYLAQLQLTADNCATATVLIETK